MVAAGEVRIDRATQPRPLVQPFVDALGFPTIGNGLCLLPVPDVREGVVGHSIFDPGLAQPARQPVMPVQADLQTAGQPGRYPHVTEAKFFIDEIEVVMQALAVIGHKIGLAGLFVVPWLVRRTWLHRRQDADQSRASSPFCQQFLCPILFPYASRSDELDLDAGFLRHPLRILANPLTKRFREFRIVENPHLSCIQKRRHSSGVADPRQRAEYQHPVIATQYPRNL